MRHFPKFSPLAVPLVLDQAHAAEALAVWSFARSFGPALQLHPFSLEELCTALERDETPKVRGRVRLGS